MNSKSTAYTEAFVWIWLPGETRPVVAGKLTREGSNLVFNYGKSYLERPNRISIYDKELPLKLGILPLLPGLMMPGCIRDASPDAWGRRVLIHKKFGVMGGEIDDLQLDELSYLLESGSDRIGALDFQLSATEYQPRLATQVTLDELVNSANLVEKGIPLPHQLAIALNHGTAIGGARPKALIEDDQKKYIAKFSSTSDTYNVVKAEFIAMRLAKEAGLNVAPVSLKKSFQKDVLLIERFDRIIVPEGWQRKSVVSALTLFEFNEMMVRYASYETLAELIRQRFEKPTLTLRELFKRMIFNLLVGNTDDHARNHAAFWDGHKLTLTPAYDICPQARTGNMATQGMLISGDDRKSQIMSCLSVAGNFLLSRQEALKITENLFRSLIENWNSVCDLAELDQVGRNFLGNRQFLNPYIFENLGQDSVHLIEYQKKFKAL